MEKIKWEQISVSFQYKAGQLTDKRVQRIIEELKESNIIVNASVRPNNDVLILLLDNSGGAFVIAPDNLSYNLPSIEDKFSFVKKHLSAMMDILGVEDKNIYVVNAQGSTPCVNSHDETRETFSLKNKDVLDDYKDIYAVGYRFLIKNESYNGEFKIEPMVADSKKYYYQYIINTQSAITVDELCSFVKECLEKEFESLREVL